MSSFRACTLILSVSLLSATVTSAAAENRPGRSLESKKRKKEQSPGEDGRKKLVEAAEPAPVKEPAPAPLLPATPRPANGSLYTDQAPAGNLFTDFKAERPGDLVFIDIVETSTATVTSNASRNRDSGTLGGLTGAAGALPGPGATISGVLGGLGSRKFEGNGQTTRTSSMTARVAARVTQVMPNGDLQVEAHKLVKINKEDEMVTLSGIVRRRDITADNAIPTTVIGNLRVAINGKGVASADNAPGWLYRLFEKVAPF